MVVEAEMEVGVGVVDQVRGEVAIGKTNSINSGIGVRRQLRV
jgi:hypothetical protein